MLSLDPPSGFESQDRMYQGNRVFITFPAFHVGLEMAEKLCLDG